MKLEGDLYERAATLIRSAFLDDGDMVMPGEAGTAAGHWSTNKELVALEMLCVARQMSGPAEWAGSASNTLRALDHDALTMFAVGAVRELARLDFDAVEADRRMREEGEDLSNPD